MQVSIIFSCLFSCFQGFFRDAIKLETQKQLDTDPGKGHGISYLLMFNILLL